MELVRITSAGPQLDEVKALFAEYWQSFGFTPCFQGFDAELASLPGAYAPPRGLLLLAGSHGCVAVRPIDARTAEMKRLYVRPSARGTGLGRRLALAAIERARMAGYARLVLDTMPAQMQGAISLYRALGFRDTSPYLSDPTPGALCMELELR